MAYDRVPRSATRSAAVTAADPQSATTPAAATAAFLEAVAAANRFEIDSGKLAVERADADAVRLFAQSMIDAHGRTADKLRAAAGQMQLRLPSAEPDERQRAILDRLASSSGTDFDRSYIEAQYEAHVEAVDVVKAYSLHGPDTDLKTFAADLLSMLQGHLSDVAKLR
ncbi:MAG: DUF4142 domain-containing protein [Pseudomonadota bacterium]